MIFESPSDQTFTDVIMASGKTLLIISDKTIYFLHVDLTEDGLK